MDNVEAYMETRRVNLEQWVKANVTQRQEWEVEDLEAIAFQLRAHGLEPEEDREIAEKNDRA